MDTMFGLPAHPLLVHVPVVLLPLAAIGVLVMAIKPAWHHRYRWAVLAMSAAGAIGAVLAASAGEGLQRRLADPEASAAAARVERHAALGDTARNVALVFACLVMLDVLVPWWLERRAGRTSSASRSATTRWLPPTVMVLTLIAAAGSVATIVRAGHSGSNAVWNEQVGQRP